MYHRESDIRHGKPVKILLCMLLTVLFLLSVAMPALSVAAAEMQNSTSLSASCKDEEGLTYRVTVTFGEDAGIPADAELSVIQIKTDNDVFAHYAKQAADALGCSDGTATSTKLFDISLVSRNDGSYYQPVDGASVDVKVRLAEATDNELAVVHFGDEPEVLSSSVSSAGKVVSFETTGFSVYAFVDIVGGDNWVTDVTALDETPLYLSVTSDAGKTYYIGKDLVGSGTNIRLVKTAANSTVGATAYRFEKLPDTEATYNMYRYNDNGEKIYLKLTKNTNVQFVTDSSNATAFTAIPDGTGLIALRFLQGSEYYYLNMRGSDKGTGFGGSTYYDSGSKFTVVRTLFPEEILDLDGKSYGLAIPTEKNTAALLTAEAKDDNSLVARSCNVRANPLVSGNDVIIDADHDIFTYTFHAINGSDYYITTLIGGTTKYLRLQNNSLTLADQPDDYSVFRAVLGSAANAGKIRFVSAANTQSAISLKDGTVANGFTGKEVSNETTYFKLLTPTILDDDDFVPYTAIKVSVSDTAKVHNGSQVVIYTRIWNDTEKQYEFYAINHDGSLKRVYDEGSTIRWAGTQVNTMLWDFTEYYYWPYSLKIPNYYYELQNTYSGKYIAPQYGTVQILSDSTIGVNLNGRRFGEDYTTILAWDDYRYDYAGIRSNADNSSIESVPMTKAQDFHFAIMDDPVPDEFSTAETVDNHDHGIKMRMINFQGHITNARNDFQTSVMGSDTTEFTKQVPTLGLVTTDFAENGYPTATHTNTSLEELFGDATEVNHLFLTSIYNESGYFEYNCTQTFATLKDDGDFRIYNQIGSVINNAPSQGHGWFMPYNDISPDILNSHTNQTDVHNQPLATDDPRLGEVLYGIPANDAQYYFGMEMEASFIQSKDGLDAWGHDIIFEFAGDDDMWLYVDGELVLDLGGVHSALVGKINFRTGVVELPELATDGLTQKTTTLRALFEQNYRTRNPEATDSEVLEFLNRHFKEGTTVFKDYTSHTMKMYYMERGAGASNLHMRFNLTTATDGQLLLSKEVSGTDKQDYASMKFPYQIWYFDRSSADWRRVSRTESTVEGKTVYDYSGVTYVNYEGSKIPVEYAEHYYSYPDVFFLKPGEVAEVQFPDDEMEYMITECRIDTEIYDAVYANDVQLIGVVDSEGFENFSTEPEVIGDRKIVKYTNNVNEDALRTLQIKKKLYDVNGNELSYAEDDTGFRFRLYIGEGDDLDGLGYYRMDSYYVKDPDGNYCKFDHETQKFASIGKSVFSDLTDDELEVCTFTTSPSGAIDKIPTTFTVEVRNLLIDTKFMVVERESDIPKGYDFIQYVRDDGSYLVEDGDSVNRGTIRARQSPTVIVENHRGWGLTVEKVWSDADFMSSHDDIYFAVYCNDTLVDGTVRRMKTSVSSPDDEPETSLYYYFKELQDGAVFADYTVREVTLEGLQVDPDGTFTYTGVTPIADDGVLVNGGTPTQTGTNAEFRYSVTYSTGSPTGPGLNVRTDVVANSRPGVRLIKTDGSGSPLPGAVFSLVGEKTNADGSKEVVLDQSFTSGANGQITFAYPEADVVYTLTETSAPVGYSNAAKQITFYEDDDGLHVTGADSDSVTVSEADSAGTITISIKNYETEIVAVKVDSGSNEPIPDVHFALYRQVLGTNGLRKDYYPMAGYSDLVTGTDGVIPGIDVSLPVGTYYLTESATPEGYFELDHDVIISVDEFGVFSVISEGDEGMLTDSTNNAHRRVFTLTIPNVPTMKSIALSPQTLVADYGLGIEYNAKINNYLVSDTSVYTYIGVTDMKNYNSVGTKSAPPLLAAVGEPCVGKFGTLTLLADGTTDYDLTSTMFSGEDEYCLVAHVTKIDGENADVYAYEVSTYIPATTVYYEDDFISEECYVNGVDGQSTGHDFGIWGPAEGSRDGQEFQAADLAGVKDANIYGFDPAYTECADYSNNSAHVVSVSEVNAPNKGGQWPSVSFDFAGTGFDLVTVTGCDTGVFTVNVYNTEVDDQGNVTLGDVEVSRVVDTFYGFDYGPLYVDDNGAPTHEVTGRRLYEATQDIIDDPGSTTLFSVGGRFMTLLPTYYAPDGTKSRTPYYFDKEGKATAEKHYIDRDTNAVVSSDEVEQDAEYAPNYSYAEASGWLVNSSADKSLYQIPSIKISGLKYGTYRAVIEPRFLSYFGHYKTVDDYKYFDLYVDAFRVYDPAGSGEDGTLTSTVIKEAYAASGEAYECFTTLKNVIVGSESMGVLDDDGSAGEGAVLVDGGETLNTEQMQDYVAFGPNNELYLGKGMSVAFEICATSTPTDVQLQLKKISAADPTLQILYYEKDGTLFNGTIPISSATDQSYSVIKMIGSSNIKWTKLKNVGVTSGLVVISNVGEKNSIISITNLKWTFTAAGEKFGISNVTAKPTVRNTSAANIKTAMSLASKNISVQASEETPAVYSDGTITITVNTGSDVDSLVITDLYGNEIDPETLEYSFTDVSDTQRLWTVTVSEDEDGTHNYLIRGAGEDFISSETVRVVVNVENNTETGDAPSTDGGSSSSKTLAMTAFIEKIRDTLMKFIDMLRQLLSFLGT